MKVLILAAGYGTRLLPHTKKIPKALFPVSGRPLIDIIIRQLIHNGCSGVIINTHHLHADITDFVLRQRYSIPVLTRFEQQILGTGGAIKNVSDFLGDQPFLVINSDILTDLNLRAVYAFHLHHGHPVTMVMHEYPQLNTVWLDAEDNVIGFDPISKNNPAAMACLAFTGIQVVDPMVMAFIPQNRFITSIDVYRRMIDTGHKIKAYICKDHYWRDIGSPESYFEAVYEKTAALSFLKAFGSEPSLPLTRTLLAGDGSERKWYRITSGEQSLVMADHGITSDQQTAEVDSFISIGTHLYEKGISVPEIHYYEKFSGIVYLQDLGDNSLQLLVQKKNNPPDILTRYKSVIDQFLRMSVTGAESFDPSWTYQTPAYNKDMIMERECRYFLEAFLNGYLGMGASFDVLKNEFSILADLALENAVIGFMHRDLQSRNIMVKEDKVYFIDFQGGRLGPIQYDLASLLNDPYVNLSESVRTVLMQYCLKKLQTMIKINANAFILGYQFCTITRLLQALGAFGFLSRVKHKTYFETYIPIALINLKNRLESLRTDSFKELKNAVSEALTHMSASLSSSSTKGGNQWIQSK